MTARCDTSRFVTGFVTGFSVTDLRDKSRVRFTHETGVFGLHNKTCHRLSRNLSRGHGGSDFVTKGQGNGVLSTPQTRNQTWKKRSPLETPSKEYGREGQEKGWGIGGMGGKGQGKRTGENHFVTVCNPLLATAIFPTLWGKTILKSEDVKLKATFDIKRAYDDYCIKERTSNSEPVSFEEFLSIFKVMLDVMNEDLKNNPRAYK